MYLNTVEFSDGAFGIKSATRTYFSKDPDSLTIPEAAVLVGMLKAPYRFNPRIHQKRSLSRRNIVIGQMLKYGRINQAHHDSLTALPIELHFNRSSHTSGLAPYFREYLRLDLQRWARDSVNYKMNGEPYNIYRDGLKIYTTTDSIFQVLCFPDIQEFSGFIGIFVDAWQSG